MMFKPHPCKLAVLEEENRAKEDMVKQLQSQQDRFMSDSRYVERVARERNFKELFCLSTQADTYFQQKGGYREAAPENLPAARRALWEQSKRNSRVLVKSLI